MEQKNFLIFVLVVIFGVSRADRLNIVRVKGIVLCDDKPLNGATIKIEHQDPEETGGAKWYVGDTKSGQDGSFEITGSLVHMESLNPSLVITSDCTNKKYKQAIPGKYVFVPDPMDTSDVSLKAEVYDAGKLNLKA